MGDSLFAPMPLTPMVRLRLPFLLLAVATVVLPVGAADASAAAEARPTLDDCIARALANNQRRPASRFALAAAEAQHRQVLSAYWPQMQVRSAYERQDEGLQFITPSFQMPVGPLSLVAPASTAMVTVPAGVLGPAAVQLPVSVPAQTVTMPATAVTVPEQRIEISDSTSVRGSVGAAWLLYDGGMRRGLRQQSRAQIAAEWEAVRRTDLEIIETVSRYYHGAVLARQLHTLGRDTLERMAATLRVTESLYQGGGGTVKKTDYLDNRILVETLRAMVAALARNEVLARAALANTMGLPWEAEVAPAATEIPHEVVALDPAVLVSEAYEFSPDWRALAAGLDAAEGAVRSARSGHAPKVQLSGDLHRWWNDGTHGLATDDNKRGWTVGVGVQVPLFDGFRTRAEVAEARARLERMKTQRLLLKDGLGLQIKDLVLQVIAHEAAWSATAEARTAAIENRELCVRAYQSELLETERVLRAQLIEALTTAQHYKAAYDHAEARARLAALIGGAVSTQMAQTR